MQKFNLVFVPDSNYSHVIIEKFEKVAPDFNIYVCISNEKKYLNHEKVNYINIKNFSSYNGNFEFLEKKYSKIIFNLNSLLTTNFYYKYIHNNNNFAGSIKIMMFWSGELYNHPAYKLDIYDLHSIKYKKSFKKIYASKFVDFFLNILKFPSYSKYYKLNSNMDYFCGFFESEHIIYNSVFESKSKFVLFTFLDSLLMKLPRSFDTNGKDDILIGNSGAQENNHIEVFTKIKQIANDSYNNIIVPLSYGDSEYIKSIITLGNEYLGSQFLPLTDFLGREAYNEKIRNVKVAIFNHYIQQAVGNILFMLHVGSRVYLNHQNPLYKGFLEKKFIINSLAEFNLYGLQPLSAEEKEYNRLLIDKYLNVDESLSYYKSIIEL